jgi:hypothetical protein
MAKSVALACYGSTLGSNPDISDGVTDTLSHSSPPKKYTKNKNKFRKLV